MSSPVIPDINGQPNFLPVVIAPNEEYEVPANSDTPGQLSANPRIANQKDTAKLRRPPNAFILYRSHRQKEVKEANKGIHNNDISAILGKSWANETDAIRSHYASLANAIKDEFMMRYPNYQFQPRRSAQIRRRTRHGHSAAAAPPPAAAAAGGGGGAAAATTTTVTMTAPPGAISMPSTWSGAGDPVQTFTNIDDDA